VLGAPTHVCIESCMSSSAGDSEYNTGEEKRKCTTRTFGGAIRNFGGEQYEGGKFDARSTCTNAAIGSGLHNEHISAVCLVCGLVPWWREGLKKLSKYP
jgi:hypothetical protein